MNVQLIGTGGIYTKYNSACYLIDEKIMVDFPNGTLKKLYKKDIIPNQINYILITHFHGDHYFDMPFYLLNKLKNDKNNINIYCSKDGKSKIKKICKLAFPYSFNKNCSLKNIQYNFTNFFKIEDYEVKKILVNHGNMKPAYGYIFNKDNINIGFTGDTSLCENVLLMAEKCHYLFCDCMYIKGNTKHQGIDNIIYLHNKYPKCVLVVSHLEDETRKELKKLKLKDVIIPDDGQIINIQK